MSDMKPKTLRLADEVDEVAEIYPDMAEVSAELRRLHAANVDCMAWYEAIKSDYEALRKAAAKLHAAKGRYHTQIAACDLYDLCDLKNERPTK